jgi:hypothetical protein
MPEPGKRYYVETLEPGVGHEWFHGETVRDLTAIPVPVGRNNSDSSEMTAQPEDVA